MNILITGGAGYLGSVLTEKLLWGNHHVTVLDNFVHRVPSLAHICRHDGLTIVNGDARNYSLMRTLLKKADIVIPLAAVVGAPACVRDAVTAVTLNFEAVRWLCEDVSDNQLIIYPNTNSGYGVGGAAECTEDQPLNPISLYGQEKARAEQEVLACGGITFRFATLFGASPRMRLDLLVNDFVFRAVRDRAITLFEGGFRRNYLHVRDAASAFIFALNHASIMSGEVYNAGLSEANLTKRELCEVIRQQVEFVWNDSPIGKDPDKRDYIVSNAKLEALGWVATHSLQDGIAELIRTYQMPFESYRNV